VVCGRLWQPSPPGWRPSRAQRWQSFGAKLAWVIRSVLVALRPIARWSMEGLSLLCQFFQSLSATCSLGSSAGLSMGSMRGRCEPAVKEVPYHLVLVGVVPCEPKVLLVRTEMLSGPWNCGWCPVGCSGRGGSITDEKWCFCSCRRAVQTSSEPHLGNITKILEEMLVLNVLIKSRQINLGNQSLC
jgi:hypothetical protein